MYSGSQTSSKDVNLLFPESTFKNSSRGEFQRNNITEVSMDVNLFHRHHQQQHHQNQQQNQQRQQNQQQFNSGLMRYRSAPTSLLEKLINGDDDDDEGEGCDNFIPPHSIPEAESIFARFMSCAGNDSDLTVTGEKSAVTANTVVNNRNPQFMTTIEQEPEENGFPPTSQMMFQTPISQPQQSSLKNQNSNPTDNSYRVVSSMGMDQNPSQLKMNCTANSSNLIRHSSSPAGLLANLNVENGYAVMRGMGGNFRAGNVNNGELTAPNSRLKNQMSFPSRPPTSSGLMSQISEIESDSIGGGNSGEEGSLSNGNGNNSNNRFIPGFPIASWDDSGIENFTGTKRARDNNNKMFSGLNHSETQNGEVGNHTTPGLTHHFSLPKTSAEMAAILQFQDSVPCKIRAKRGCATHPRSIAERVRRTRISERMRKLQELVPNMDKQTNTADMLDLAVEYIKDLQKQVKTLNDNRANCTCSSKQKL